MARGKSSKLKPFEKLLTIMVSGKPVTVEEIDATLGQEIHMYRLSTYIWHIKTFANGTVKAIKDGRKVVAYQVMNVDEVKEYLKDTKIDVSNFVAGKATKIVRSKKATTQTVAPAPKAQKPVKQISDLNAKPVKKEKIVDVIEVEEITEEFDTEVNDIVDDIRSNIVE
jgi:hypothetical protein